MKCTDTIKSAFLPKRSLKLNPRYFEYYRIMIYSINWSIYSAIKRRTCFISQVYIQKYDVNKYMIKIPKSIFCRNANRINEVKRVESLLPLQTWHKKVLGLMKILPQTMSGCGYGGVRRLQTCWELLQTISGRFGDSKHTPRWTTSCLWRRSAPFTEMRPNIWWRHLWSRPPLF